MSEAAQFHPEIENALETRGEDVGRLKDVDLAHELALGENEVRKLDIGYVPKEERLAELRDDNIKVILAERAVKAAASNDLRNLAITGAFDKPDYGIDTERLIDEAAQVAEDYDTVKDLARVAGEARENGAEFLDLSSEEFTAALAEAPVYRKAAIVKARRAIPGEVVITITPDGVEEGRNTAGDDDHVVTGTNGADFILPGEKFNKLYEETEETGVFQSRGMARIIDNPTGKKIGILAPWGEMQYGDAESKIAVQFDSKNPDLIGSDRYILDKGEFQAYKKV